MAQAAHLLGLPLKHKIRDIKGLSTELDAFLKHDGSRALTGNLLPDATNTRDLGSSSLEWRNIFVDGFVRADRVCIDEYIYSSLAYLAVRPHLAPQTDKLYNLGTKTRRWKRLILKGDFESIILYEPYEGTRRFALGNDGVRFTVEYDESDDAWTGLFYFDPTLTRIITNLITHNCLPSETDKYDLGEESTPLEWRNLFLTRYLKTGKVTSLPTPDSSYRGKMIRVEGGTGEPDKLYMCMKSASDTYSWVEIANGGS